MKEQSVMGREGKGRIYNLEGWEQKNRDDNEGR